MSYVAPKRSTDLLAIKILPKLHHILVLLSELFTIFGCNSPLIMMQLRTNFRSQQIMASFWCNIGQNFLECSKIKKFQSISDLGRDGRDFWITMYIYTHACIFVVSFQWIFLASIVTYEWVYTLIRSFLHFSNQFFPVTWVLHRNILFLITIPSFYL